MRQMVPNDRLFLRVQHLSRICADAICCYNQKPVIDFLTIRFTEELIYIGLCYLVVRGIALCLNSPSALVFVLEDKINAAIPTPLPRVVVPQPDVIYLGCPLRIVLQK